MKIIWKKYKVWLSGLVFLVVFGGASFLIVKPLVASIEINSDNVQQKIVDNQMNQARIAKIPEMRANHDLFQKESSKLNVTLDPGNEVDFIKKIEALAEATGNKVDLKIDENLPTQKNTKAAATSSAGDSGSLDSSGTATSSASKTKKDPEDIKANLPSTSYLVIHVSLEGSYGGFIKFLHQLENFDYYVNILAFTLAKSEQQTENVSQSGVGDIFASAPVATSGVNVDQAPPKEILKSTIDIVAYIKK